MVISSTAWLSDGTLASHPADTMPDGKQFHNYRCRANGQQGTLACPGCVWGHSAGIWKLAVLTSLFKKLEREAYNLRVKIINVRTRQQILLHIKTFSCLPVGAPCVCNVSRSSEAGSSPTGILDWVLGGGDGGGGGCLYCCSWEQVCAADALIPSSMLHLIYQETQLLSHIVSQLN